MTVDLQTLGRAVKQAQWRHHRGVDRLLSQLGTSLTMWDALRAVSQAPGASAHELAQRTFQSDQSFGTLANRLAAAGLIVRAPGTGRRIEHRLTPSGDALLAEGTAVVEGFLEESFARLDDHERNTLVDLLGRLG